MNETSRPIFYDPSQRRALYLRRIVATASVVAAAALMVFCASVIFVPSAHRFKLPLPKFLPDNPRRAGESDHRPVTTVPTSGNSEVAHLHPAAHGERATLPAPLPTVAPGRAKDVVGGFYVDWDEVSLASLREHADEMTHLFPGWLHVNDTGDGLIATDHDPSDDAARDIARKNHLHVFPLVNNFSANKNDFDETRLHLMLADPQKRTQVAEALLAYVHKWNYPGINIDLETESDQDRTLLATFTDELARRFHAAGLQVTACVQVGDTDQAAAIARPCDFVIPMIYDLHYASGDAGPIAPRDWAEQELAGFLHAVPADKTVLAIGNYAYDWENGKIGAKTLTFGEAMVTAQESRDGSDGVVTWDTKSQNPYFHYEEDGKRHDVWCLDATTAYNLMRYGREHGVSGRALWYVGSEDPALWNVFGRSRKPDAPGTLRTVQYGFSLDFEGEGEVLDVSAMPQAGERTLKTDKQGYIAGETFVRYPTSCVLRRSGKAPKTIAFTFDDGPDPQWTPLILDALKKAQVPATFFVIGVHAQEYPNLVRQMWDDGNDIGNHSFYHPNLAEVGDVRATLELDATQRAIEAAIGHSTTLFRPPYGVDSQPSTSTEVAPIALAQKLGYVTVAEGIDPRDWENGIHKKTAEQIAEQIVSDADSNQGSVVLLHDSGGDRAETVKAIPLAVAALRAKGYRFVTVSQLLGQPRNVAFPAVTGKQKWLAFVDRVVFTLSSSAGWAVALLFLFSLTAGAVRLVGVALLALRHASRPAPVAPVGYEPLVSVLIAAYNEEKVITRTIQTVLGGDYPHVEVIVVDDGSKDGTYAVATQAFGSDTRVRIIRQPNGGKASALNHAISLANGEILIGLDADTLFAPDTVALLVRHFADPTVGAVAGNIQVGNLVNRLARWQALEYTTSQNFDRRAYAMLNGIPVVPGCVGAWRASAVREVGAYQTDTLAEDADLTWRVRRAGWRILCDNDARAYTEAPEKLRDLLKQRFRWTYGTLQVLWKHRKVLGNARYGAFGLVIVPMLWMFQFVLPALVPIADVGLIMAGLAGDLAIAGLYFLAFLVLEVSAAALAMYLDGADARRRQLLWEMPIQRIAYRYVLFVVLFRSLQAAIAGARASWNKLDRRGNARVANSR